MNIKRDGHLFWNGLFVLIFCILVIIPSLLYLRGEIGVDEGFYLFKGYSILEGTLQQHDYWKVGTIPAISFLLAGIFSIYGKSVILPRILVYVVNGLSAILIYKIGKTWDSSSVGKIASILFLIAMIIPQFEAYYLILEPFVAVLCLMALYLFIKSKSIYNLIFIGILIGLAILFKLVALLFVVGLVGYFVFNLRSYNHRNPDYYKSSLVHIFYVIIGIIIPVTVSAVYFLLIGSLDTFLSFYWDLIVARGVGFNIWNFSPVFFSFLVVWVFLFATIVLFFRDYFTQKYNENELLFISMLANFSLPLLSRQYGHYFILILPFAFLLAAKSFDKLIRVSIINLPMRKINKKNCLLVLAIIATLFLIIPSFSKFSAI